MAENDEKVIRKINGIATNYLSENFTIVDLSNSCLSEIDECIKFPVTLCEINLSHNSLKCVPQTVICLQKLKRLDISWNSIEYFDDTPSFCHFIEELDISNNKLLSPPYWIWSESPKKLTKINVSNNLNITSSLDSEYFEELLQYRTIVHNVIMYDCRISKHLEILSTFPSAKSIILGTKDLNYSSANMLLDVPCPGLNKCCNIEKLNLHYTFVCNIMPDIATYRTLKEIDLSQNKIRGLPKEFCALEHLEVCLLSYNCILYLPDEFVHLKKLRVLCIDNNELCMLSVDLYKLENLKTLDLYNNHLNEAPDITTFDEIDLAQNYFDEPNDGIYLGKRNKLRLYNLDRCSGRKPELIKSESEYSSKTSDDESIMGNHENNLSDLHERPPSSSSEDWDSEEWWEPSQYQQTSLTPPNIKWLTFIKRKMEDGNFCPSDSHTIPIGERVKYEKLCHPQLVNDVEGQFDDCSEDDD